MAKFLEWLFGRQIAEPLDVTGAANRHDNSLWLASEERRQLEEVRERLDRTRDQLHKIITREQRENELRDP